MTDFMREWRKRGNVDVAMSNVECQMSRHVRQTSYIWHPTLDFYTFSLGKLCTLPCETHESPKGDYAVSLGKRTQTPRCRVSGVAVFRPSCRQQTVISPAFRHIFSFPSYFPSGVIYKITNIIDVRMTDWRIFQGKTYVVWAYGQ